MVTIKYSDIFSSCEQMSAYEGRRAVDGNGESLFPEVHLTSQDLTLVKSYARQACDIAAQTLDYILADTTETEDTYSFDFKNDASLVIRSNATKDLTSMVGSYVMVQWLGDKLPERATAWKAIFDGTLTTLPRLWYRLKPTL